jgi:hypothetical protein
MATVAVAIFEPQTGALTYALAGHPAPILSGVDLPEPPEVCCSPPLGSGLATGRRQTTLSLAPDAIACFYTDGLSEARCSSGEKLLGRRRLRKLVELLADPADAEQLLEAVGRVTEQTPDDMAACILSSRTSGQASPRCYTEELELDRLDISSGRLGKFLRATGVDTDGVALPTREALATVERHGSALLRVEQAGDAVTARVAAPDAEPTAQMAASPQAECPPTELPLAGVAA